MLQYKHTVKILLRGVLVMKGVHFKTFGQKFVEDVSKANNKEDLFKALKETCCKTASINKVNEEVDSISLPDSKEVVKLAAAAAKFKVESADRKLQMRILAAKNIDKVKDLVHKYIQNEKNYSRVRDYAVIGMNEYLSKNFGSVEEFKTEFKALFAPEKKKEMNLNKEKLNQQQAARA